MLNFSEELEKILSQVLMKHHDDISSQDDDAIAEARDTIIELVKEIIPKAKGQEGCVGFIEDDNEWNSCRTEMLRRVK